MTSMVLVLVIAAGLVCVLVALVVAQSVPEHARQVWVVVWVNQHGAVSRCCVFDDATVAMRVQKRWAEHFADRHGTVHVAARRINDVGDLG